MHFYVKLRLKADAWRMYIAVFWGVRQKNSGRQGEYLFASRIGLQLLEDDFLNFRIVIPYNLFESEGTGQNTITK